MIFMQHRSLNIKINNITNMFIVFFPLLVIVLHNYNLFIVEYISFNFIFNYSYMYILLEII